MNHNAYFRGIDFDQYEKAPIMLKKLLTSLCCILAFYVFSNAQIWKIELESENDSYFREIIPVNDGNYVALGGLDSGIGWNNYRVIVYKISPDGEIIWSKQFESELKEKAFHISELENGDLLIVGEKIEENFGRQLVMRISGQGDLIWKQTYDLYSLYYSLPLEDGSILAGGWGPTLKISANGDVIWSNSYNLVIKKIVPLNNGTYLLAGGTDYSGFTVMAINTDGDIIWEKKVANNTSFSVGSLAEPPNAISLDAEGNIIVAYPKSSEFFLGLWKFDVNGNQLWHHTYAYPINYLATFDLILKENGHLLLLGQTFTNGVRGWLIVELNAEGYDIWRRRQSKLGLGYPYSGVIIPEDSTIILAGVSQPTEEGYQRGIILRTGPDGSEYLQKINGSVWIDRDNDCTLSDNDIPAPFWGINIFGTDTLDLLTNAEGQFELEADVGQHLIQLSDRYPDWETCNTEYLVELSAQETINDIVFLVKPTGLCPKLRVDIAPTDLVRCEESRFFIHWQNPANSTAEDVRLEIKLTEELILIDASAPYELTGNILQFELGNVPALGEGRLSLDCQLTCDVVLGASHCVEARIFHSNACMPIAHPDWSGASLSVKGICENGIAQFTIRNSGEGDMLASQQYQLFADGIAQNSGEVFLNANDSTAITFPTRGRTIHLSIPQVPHHPGKSLPGATLEGCGQDEAGFHSTGYFNVFNHDEGEPSIAYACVENNLGLPEARILGIPKGLGGKHITENGEEQEFIIKFQNPLNELVQDVHINLYFSDAFILPSFEVVASSHPYNLHVTQDGTLKIHFPETLLSAASMDFINASGSLRIKVKKKQNLQDETKLFVRGEIFFNFEGPFRVFSNNAEIKHNFPTELSLLDTESTPGVFQYGGFDVEAGYQMIPTANGSIFIVGTSKSYGLGGDPYILKINQNGQGEWFRPYKVSQHQEVLTAGALTSDEGLIAIGYQRELNARENALGTKPFLIRIDENGELLWEKYALSGVNTSNARPHGIVEKSNGNFVIGGTPPFLTEINPDGELVWAQTYDYTDLSFGEIDLVATSDEGYFFSGLVSGHIGITWYDLFAQKHNSEGEIEWTLLEEEADYSTRQIITSTQLADGSFLIAGQKFGFDGPPEMNDYFNVPLLIRITPQGTILWEHTLDSDTYAYITDVVPLTDGTFIVKIIETLSYNPYIESTVISRIDANGTLLSEQVIEGGFTDFILNEETNQLFLLSNRNAPLQSSQIVFARDNLVIVNDREIWSTEEITVFPIPVNDELHVILPEGVKFHSSSWRLFDAQGTQVGKGKVYTPNFSLSTRNFSNGFYVLQVKAGELLFNKKIIIQR